MTDSGCTTITPSITPITHNTGHDTSPPPASARNLINEYTDWKNTALGAKITWPPMLTCATELMLNAPVPSVLVWGKDYTLLYNDLHTRLKNDFVSHTQMGLALAKSTDPVLQHFYASITETGGPRLIQPNVRFVLQHRVKGWVEFFCTVVYTPLCFDGASPTTPSGYLIQLRDVTEAAVAERREALLDKFTTATMNATNGFARELTHQAVVALQESHDIPMVMCFVPVEGNNKSEDTYIHIFKAFNSEVNESEIPTQVAYYVDEAGEEISSECRVVKLPVPQKCCDKVLVMPIGRDNTMMVCGISRYMPFDATYKSFFVKIFTCMRSVLHNAFAHDVVKRHSHTMAEVDKAKVAMLEKISNELRTPVTLLLGGIDDSIQKIRNLAISPHHFIGLQAARRNGERLLKLVDSLMDFSKTESIKHKKRFQPTLLGPFTVSLAQCFKGIVEHVGVKLTLDCDSVKDAIVYVDHDMWEQIIINLLSNAAKHTFKGEIKITMRLVDDGGSGCLIRAHNNNCAIYSKSNNNTAPHILCEVSDTGVGIPSSAMPHLFDRLIQLQKLSEVSHFGDRLEPVDDSGVSRVAQDNDTEGEDGATNAPWSVPPPTIGGVDIIADFIGNHMGTLQVHSEVNKGATFSIFLPLGYTSLPPDYVVHIPSNYVPPIKPILYINELQYWNPQLIESTRSTDLIPVTVTPTNLPGGIGGNEDWSDEFYNDSRGLVVLVDDNSDMRAYVSSLLSEFHVDVYSNGHEALHAIFTSHELPDIIIAELMMPSMDGLQLVDNLRCNPRTAGIPVVLISTLGAPDETVEGGVSRRAAAEYLKKPFSSAVLIAKVKTQIKLSKIRRDANQAMIKASNAKSAFCARVSHELRTPLNSIIGMINLLYETQLTEEQLDFLRIVKSSGGMLLDLVNDLLDLERADTNQMSLIVSLFFLPSLIEEVLMLMTERAGSSGVELVCDIDPLLYQNFIADHGRIRQILINLIGNGIKFSPGGTVMLTVTAIPPPSTNAFSTNPDIQALPVFVRFEVIDTGIGISPELKKRLFQAFSQGDSAAKFGGSGLGLAISRQLVSLMHGTIGVESDGESRRSSSESEEGTGVSDKKRGSTFWFEIPLLFADQHTTPKTKTPKRKPTAPTTTTPTITTTPSLAPAKLMYNSNNNNNFNNNNTNGPITKHVTFDDNLTNYNYNNNNNNNKTTPTPTLSRYAPSSLLYGKSVVVVDCNTKVVGSLTNIMTYEGMNVTSFPDLDYVTTTKADFLIVKFTRSNCATVFHKLGSLQQYFSYVIAMGTEMSINTFISQMKATHATINNIQVLSAYIVKPITKHKLIPKLESLLTSPKQPLIPELPTDQTQQQTTPNTTQPTTEQPKTVQIAAKTPQGKKHKILVCEDNSVNRKVIGLQLQKLGWESEMAQNGMEGVLKFAENPTAYSAILMDMEMPVMDGIAATEEIRSNENIYNTKLRTNSKDCNFPTTPITDADELASSSTTTTTSSPSHTASSSASSTSSSSSSDEFVRPGERKRLRSADFLAVSIPFGTDINGVMRKQRIPIIALTANCFEEGRQRCLKAGMDDFLVKPINTKILQDTLQKWCIVNPPS